MQRIGPSSRTHHFPHPKQLSLVYFILIRTCYSGKYDMQLEQKCNPDILRTLRLCARTWRNRSLRNAQTHHEDRQPPLHNNHMSSRITVHQARKNPKSVSLVFLNSSANNTSVFTMCATLVKNAQEVVQVFHLQHTNKGQR